MCLAFLHIEALFGCWAARSREECARRVDKVRGLALMAIGALLGVEVVGGDDEHVVALDTHAVTLGLGLLAGGRRRFGFVGVAHKTNSIPAAVKEVKMPTAWREHLYGWRR